MSRSVPPSELPEGDYFAVEAMVKETPLGRWFLEEHAKRHAAGDAGVAVDALSKLSELSGAGVNSERLNEILDLIAEARRDPSNDRSARSAEAGTAAIRKVVEKIREVAFELREAGKLDIYASALELYCTDMLGATDAQEGAVRRVGDLAGVLATVESTIAGMVGRELPDEPIAPMSRQAVPVAPQREIRAELVPASEKDAIESAVVEPPMTKTEPNRVTAETKPLAETKPAAPAGAEAPKSAPVAPPPRTIGEPNAMNQAAPAPREPAPFEPTKTATDSTAKSASALVKEARALFFVNPN